MPRTVRTIRL